MNSNKKPFKTTDTYENKDYVPHMDRRPPESDGNGSYEPTINLKVMKDLPNSSYAVKVDPYTEANNPATPYAFLNQFNKVMGGRYAGRENLGGGNLIQYNNSVGSAFLKVFDAALVAIGLNYNYLPILSSDTARGNEMVNEMRKAISEIVSSLNATTFKDQNIFYYGVATSLPMGDAPHKTVTYNGVEYEVYYNLEDVIYAYCIEYQTFIQNVVMVFNMFNANRSRMGTMIKMSWNREVAVLNSYFGLLKKKSFLALFDSIAMNMAGEFVDQDFMRQANTFCMAASRRSNSINDPLLEVTASINMPESFKAFLFADAEKTTIAGIVYDQDELTYQAYGSTRSVPFMEAVKTLQIRLTVEDTLDWARNVTAEYNENDRFNTLKQMIDVVTYCIQYFKTAITDLRTVLTIMARIGVVRWSLGTRLGVTRDTDCVITNYLVVNNVYEEIFSGATAVKFNSTTMRWRTHTLWNLYYGTPEYAKYSGGAFFTFSVKDIDDSSSAFANTGYLPIAFSLSSLLQEGQYCVLSARDGARVFLTREDTKMADNSVLGRLVPLRSQEDLEIFVPTPVSPSWSGSDTQRDAFLYRVMLQIAGVGKSAADDYSLDPDTIAIYEYEIEDFTNEVIAYSRSHGPFQVSAFTENTLGFYGLKEGRK